jgi:hypothetical protein
MTCYGTPGVYKIGEILIVAPWNKEKILTFMKIEKAFEFWGPWFGIKIKDKKTMLFDDVFGDSRMARITRIAMDLEIPYQNCLKKYGKDKKERADILRKTKITATENLIFKLEDKENLSCPVEKCGRRFAWSYGELSGRCPRYNCNIGIEKCNDGMYKVTKLEIRT